MKNKEQQLMLIVFLNWINKRVLESLKGSFFKTAKYKFNLALKASENFQKEALGKTDDNTFAAFEHYSHKMAEVMNIAIDHYHDKKLEEFIEHCKIFKG